MAPNDEKEAPLLPWDNFSNWVHAICVVTFDLELGQAMEVCKPGYYSSHLPTSVFSFCFVVQHFLMWWKAKETPQGYSRLV